MRISDWSSDVCSSDLKGRPSHPRFRRRRRQLSIYRNHTADCKRQIYSAGFVFWHWSLYCAQTARTFISPAPRSEEHTSELQSLMRISYAVFCLKKKKNNNNNKNTNM